jgi:ABC-type multidrug transport system ATPase subunit
VTSAYPAIVVNDVTVTFRPLIDRKPTLRWSLGRLRHREKGTLIALDNVSVTVSKGEAFGVIGLNGAGKSTLLKVMAKTLKPPSGTVKVPGQEYADDARPARGCGNHRVRLTLPRQRRGIL